MRALSPPLQLLPAVQHGSKVVSAIPLVKAQPKLPLIVDLQVGGIMSIRRLPTQGLNDLFVVYGHNDGSGNQTGNEQSWQRHFITPLS